MYSFSWYTVRILEVYYQAGTLFVRKTPYVDLAEENKETIKLLLRWMMSEPSGSTSFASGNGTENDPDIVSDKASMAESSASHSSEE